MLYKNYYEKMADHNVKIEVPFTLPDNWCWVKFSNLVNFELGKTPDRHQQKYWSQNKYTWFSISDMKDKEHIYYSKERISNYALEKYFNNKLSPKGTLIMSFKLTIGRVSILDIDSVHNEAIISIYPYIDNKNIFRDYLFNTLGLLVTYVEQTDAIKGSTLNKNKLKNMLIPLPPIDEQTRILSAINNLLYLINDQSF